MTFKLLQDKLQGKTHGIYTCMEVNEKGDFYVFIYFPPFFPLTLSCFCLTH